MHIVNSQIIRNFVGFLSFFNIINVKTFRYWIINKLKRNTIDGC